MCERLACIIPKECLRVAHHYWGPEGYECPEWRDPSLEGTYECSYNMPPQSFWYFERQKQTKQAFFVYCQQLLENSMRTRQWDAPDIEDVVVNDEHWQGPKLLTMAGLFDINKGHYSFTILTRRAPPYLRWLHNRVPVILDNEDAIASWLDPARDFDELIRSPTVQSSILLDWHQVPDFDGNVNNKSMLCVLPMENPEPQPTSRDAWLSRLRPLGGRPSTSRSRSPVKSDEPERSNSA